jgi:four helix bundle protein
MDYVKTFRDLQVYKLARQLAKEIFEATKDFPFEERFSLTDQMRRSSRSVGAQIAEAWAKRRYVSHFVSKLTDADGEQQETQHWLGTAHECGYLNDLLQASLLSRYEEIGKMLQSMIDKADSFCGQRK